MNDGRVIGLGVGRERDGGGAEDARGDSRDDRCVCVRVGRFDMERVKSATAHQQGSPRRGPR